MRKLFVAIFAWLLLCACSGQSSELQSSIMLSQSSTETPQSSVSSLAASSEADEPPEWQKLGIDQDLHDKILSRIWQYEYVLFPDEIDGKDSVSIDEAVYFGYACMPVEMQDPYRLLGVADDFYIAMPAGVVVDYIDSTFEITKTKK